MRWQRPYVGFRQSSTPVPAGVRPVSAPLPTRFRVDALLGRGVGTLVYSAFDEDLDREVAVKVFPANLDPTSCRRVADEALAQHSLDHHCLVSVFDGGVHRDRPYLVMQLIRGQSMSARLRTGPLSQEIAVPVIALLADGLAHAHGRGVVHRDVKPSNILLDPQGVPYLSDFGIALLSSSEDRVTGADEIVGTPAYLAPEQVYGGWLGPAVDVYALGLVLLECLTGQREYSGSTKMAAALARLERAPRIPATLPEPLTSLLHGMTAADPDHRPSAHECADALQAMLEQMIADRERPGTTRERPPVAFADTVPLDLSAVSDPLAAPAVELAAEPVAEAIVAAAADPIAEPAEPVAESAAAPVAAPFARPFPARTFVPAGGRHRKKAG